MKALKIIIWLSIGFLLGFSVIPAMLWIQEKRAIRANSCDITPKEALVPLAVQGDTIAYNRLWKCFYSAELLPYAFLMANKYHYKRAYFDIFTCFWLLYPETTSSLMLLDSLDETTRNLALEYLQKGAELGENDCMRTLGRYYFEGKYFDRDTILGRRLIDNGLGKEVAD